MRADAATSGALRGVPEWNPTYTLRHPNRPEQDNRQRRREARASRRAARRNA